jgi:hypothetical protein
MDCRAVALRVFFRLYLQIGRTSAAYQAPTGILTGPLEDSNNKLIHPAVVLMKLFRKVSVTLNGEIEKRTSPVGCRFGPPSRHGDP